MIDLCIVDCETTGFYPEAGHEPWEVAILKVSEGGFGRQTWQLPVDVSKADPNALAVNGWHDRSIQASLGLSIELERDGFSFLGMPPGLTGLTEFARVFTRMTAGCALVGAVPSFDERHLSKTIRKNGGCPSWHYQPIDVGLLGVGFLLGRHSMVHGLSLLDDVVRDVTDQAAPFHHPPYDSEKLTYALGLDPNDFERHTATGDVEWAWAIWQRVHLEVWDERR